MHTLSDIPTPMAHAHAHSGMTYTPTKRCISDLDTSYGAICLVCIYNHGTMSDIPTPMAHAHTQPSIPLLLLT